MEVASYVQTAGSHAASLLASLNLQREQAQFCDGVIRLRQNPGQLYLAHRCVLAASSPVLASILSSTGTLLDLQVPCLSDAVLRLVLDYIYRGTLPLINSQQQYSNLLSAARHLQMDDLEETLRTMVNNANNIAAENQPHKDINDTYCKTFNMIHKYPPSSSITCSVNTLDREGKNLDDTDICRSRNENSTDNWFRTHVTPLSNASTGCSAPESTESSINTDRRQTTLVTPQDINQSIPSTTNMNRISRVDKEVTEGQFYSAEAVKPERRQPSTGKEPVRTEKNVRSLDVLCTAEGQGKQTSGMEKTQSSQMENNREEAQKAHQFLHPHLSSCHIKVNVSSSQWSSHSPTPPYLCCGAVPVIRHSSTATLSEASSVPLYHPESLAPVGTGRASHLQSGFTDDDGTVEAMMTKHKNLYGNQDQDNRAHRDHTGTQILYFKYSSDQYARKDSYFKSNGDQSDMLEQEHNSSRTDRDEHMDVELSQNTDDDVQHDFCASSQNLTKLCRDDLPSQNKDTNRTGKGFKYKTDETDSFHYFTPKHQQPDHHRSLLGNASAEQFIQAQDPSADMKKRDINHNGRGPQHDHYSTVDRDEKSTIDAVSCPDEHDDKDVAAGNSTAQMSLEHDNNSDSPTSDSKSLQNISVSEDNLTDHVVGQSYHGRLYYHYIPNDETQLPHIDPDYKNSDISQPGHSDQYSVDGAVASPGLSSWRQHFAATDQVVLLDISDKPAELLMSYRHRSDELEEWDTLNQTSTSGNTLGDNDRQQQHRTSSAKTTKRRIGPGTGEVAESFDETETKVWVTETCTGERKSNGKVQSSPAADAVHKSRSSEGDNQTTTLTACSSPCVPDSEQTDVSSTLSVCIPSNLSASTPRNTPAHLSPPGHYPIQCTLCSRSFSQRGSLNRHMRSHLGVRPFPCPRCPMTFSRQYRVLEHMRVHQRCVLGGDFQKSPASLM
ncbi:uncharacterized protein [Antennarius striatus]|uniref:uncharacterized protein n=1 Tax=Antennarius striatus TaxID=241820 RepID=UPI0035B1C6AB